MEPPPAAWLQTRAVGGAFFSVQPEALQVEAQRCSQWLSPGDWQGASREAKLSPRSLPASPPAPLAAVGTEAAMARLTAAGFGARVSACPSSQGTPV